MEKVLYKVLHLGEWRKSQNSEKVLLSPFDDAFIHLATEEQLNRIITKFFADDREVVILKLDPNKLQGNLVYESNPGGSTKYYHLYNGSIPLNAILESKIVSLGNSTPCCE